MLINQYKIALPTVLWHCRLATGRASDL